MSFDYTELFAKFPKAAVMKGRAEFVNKRKEELKSIYEKHSEEMTEIRYLIDEQAELGKTHLYTNPIHDDVKWMLKLLGYKINAKAIISGGHRTLIEWG